MTISQTTTHNFNTFCCARYEIPREKFFVHLFSGTMWIEIMVRLTEPTFSCVPLCVCFGYLACDDEMSDHSILDLFIVIFLCLDITFTHSLFSNLEARVRTWNIRMVLLFFHCDEERNWPLPTFNFTRPPHKHTIQFQLWVFIQTCVSFTYFSNINKLTITGFFLSSQN